MGLLITLLVQNLVYFREQSTFAIKPSSSYLNDLPFHIIDYLCSIILPKYCEDFPPALILYVSYGYLNKKLQWEDGKKKSTRIYCAVLYN